MKKFYSINLLLTNTLLLLLIGQSNATTYTVNSTGWANTGGGTSGDLLWCFNQVNGTAGGPHTISFAGLAGSPAVITFTSQINLNSANANGLTIDGETKSGWSCGNPNVVFVGGWMADLTITNRSNVTIKAISMRSMDLNITGGSFNNVYGCWFNLNNTGTAGSGGSGAYLSSMFNISGSTDNTIGGTTCGTRNIINHGVSPYAWTGLFVLNNAARTTIKGNYFNTDKTGTVSLRPSAATGTSNILITGSSPNIIIDGNVITSTDMDGIKVTGTGSCDGLQIKNNYIGLDAAGNGLAYSNAATFGNYGSGINITTGTVNNMVITNNSIGANKEYGIHIAVSNSGVQITNNNIGLHADGVYSAAADVGNGFSGICFEVITSTNVTIDNNNICRNGYLCASPSDQKQTCGIVFQQGTVVSATISNNYIGVDRSYNLAGNEFTGLYFYSCSNMGGSNAANVMVSANVIGDNGESTGTIINSHGFASYSSNYFTLSGNYIGIGTGGQNIGNSANGIEVNTCTNFIIKNSFISYNKGRRTTADAEACAGIVLYSSSTGYIQNNIISYHSNAGAGFIANNGIVVQKGSSIKIGGTAALEPNDINNNGTHGIHIMEGADFVEIRQNKIYCNASMGISLNIATDPATVAAKSAGNNSYAVTGPTVTIGAGCNATTGGTITLSGSATGSSIVEIFNSPQSCRTCPASGGRRGEGITYKYTTTAVAGAWTYGPVAFTGDAAVTATGVGADCSGGFCRTSRFSDCEFCSLPVSWLTFESELSEGIVKLNWQTASEKNVSHFVILKSADGENFYSIGSLAAKGNTSEISSYVFSDPNPEERVTYYKIQEVDFDGKSDFSKILSVTKRDNTNVSVVPNPSNGNLKIKIQNPGEGNYFIRLINPLGQILYSREYAVTNEFNITEDLSNLPKGFYILNVLSDQLNESTELVLE